MTSDFLDSLPGKHDLSLPDWGPYSKRFFGISHLADKEYGHRFDFSVMPAIYRRKIAVPDALRPAGYLPWRAAPDLEDYLYRQELEWKDRLYADISFVKIDDRLRLVRCELVNHTELCTDFELHLVAALVPNPAEKLARPAREHWLDALDAKEILFAQPRPFAGIGHDGMRPGEVRNPEAVRGSVIAFGRDRGDRLVFEGVFAGRPLFMRYRAEHPVELRFNGEPRSFPPSAEWRFGAAVIPRGTRLEIVSDGAAGDFELDGFADTNDTPAPVAASNLPRIVHAPGTDTALLTFENIAQSYGIWWSVHSDFVRHYAVRNFNETLLYDDGTHQPYLTGYDRRGGDDHQTDVVLQPLPVAPGESRIVHALVSDGGADELADRIARFDKSPEHLEKIAAERAKRLIQFPETPETFGVERMAAVTLTNVVYPAYTKQSYIRHHTPGRRWNCLYTWDSGFIGLGLLEFDTARAAENLNAYLTEAGDRENAYIHHGSPVPVQIYLFYELVNRTGNRELLTRFYPRVRQYYDFLAGHHPQSLTQSRSRERAVCTWDYFYNSGGWDDYPPQWAVFRSQNTTAIPCVGTSHAIRAAKMLAACAHALDLEEDVAHYQRDIRDFTDSLRKYYWDAEAGYFSYLVHDGDGRPKEFFRHEPSGANFNMGLDGASPLIAGAADGLQKAALWQKLESGKHCWTDAGLSTVDQSAPYYRHDGYWNGSVWMPYQYFFWKAALDDGRAGFAGKIARTALRCWEREVRASYSCYEQFSISSGRGSGWHHFSALSTPVLLWFAAYRMAGHFTTGFDVWRENCTVSPEGVAADLTIAGVPGERTTVIATLRATRAQATYDGIEVEVARPMPGVFEATLPKASHGHFVLTARS